MINIIIHNIINIYMYDLENDVNNAILLIKLPLLVNREEKIKWTSFWLEIAPNQLHT